MRRFIVFAVIAIFVPILVFGGFLLIDMAKADQPRHTEITLSSGGVGTAGRQLPTRGFQGSPSPPFSLRITKPPKHGSVKIAQSGGVSTVTYQSRKGYTGRDDFAYVRVGTDRLAGTYTVGVTVK